MDFDKDSRKRKLDHLDGALGTEAKKGCVLADPSIAVPASKRDYVVVKRRDDYSDDVEWHDLCQVKKTRVSKLKDGYVLCGVPQCQCYFNQEAEEEYDGFCGLHYGCSQCGNAVEQYGEDYCDTCLDEHDNE